MRKHQSLIPVEFKLAHARHRYHLNKSKITFFGRIRDYYTTLAILACSLFIVGILFLKYKDKQDAKKHMRSRVKNIYGRV